MPCCRPTEGGKAGLTDGGGHAPPADGCFIGTFSVWRKKCRTANAAEPPLSLIGYTRVSTEEQSLGPQLNTLRAAALTRVRCVAAPMVTRIDRLSVVEGPCAKGVHLRSLTKPTGRGGKEGGWRSFIYCRATGAFRSGGRDTTWLGCG